HGTRGASRCSFGRLHRRLPFPGAQGESKSASRRDYGENSPGIKRTGTVEHSIRPFWRRAVRAGSEPPGVADGPVHEQSDRVAHSSAGNAGDAGRVVRRPWTAIGFVAGKITSSSESACVFLRQTVRSRSDSRSGDEIDRRGDGTGCLFYPRPV